MTSGAAGSRLRRAHAGCAATHQRNHCNYLQKKHFQSTKDQGEGHGICIICGLLFQAEPDR
jgi:hypothetical protein